LINNHKQLYKVNFKKYYNFFGTRWTLHFYNFYIEQVCCKRTDDEEIFKKKEKNEKKIFYQ